MAEEKQVFVWKGRTKDKKEVSGETPARSIDEVNQFLRANEKSLPTPQIV